MIVQITCAKVGHRQAPFNRKPGLAPGFFIGDAGVFSRGARNKRAHSLVVARMVADRTLQGLSNALPYLFLIKPYLVSRRVSSLTSPTSGA